LEYQGEQATTTFTPLAALAENTTYYWRIDEVGTGSVTTGAVWSFTTAQVPYSQWISTNYPSLTGSDALPGSDPDGDGLNNLGEFAFGSNPTSGASDGRLAGKLATVNGSQAFTYTLPARNGSVFTNGAPATSAPIDGIIYQVLASTGLATWNSPIERITGSDATAIHSTLPAPVSLRQESD
jgi:hypothetical protein